jgi:predicted amidohydrolase YtcJ
MNRAATFLRLGRSGLLCWVLLVLGVSRAFAQEQLPPELIRYAETVLYNGKILTADRDDADFSVKPAVAIRDGKILAVGESQAMLALAGPATKKIDLQGKSVMPGMVSSDSDNVFAGGDWTKATQVGDRIITRGNMLEWGGGTDRDAVKGNGISGLNGAEVAKNLQALTAIAKPGESIYVRAPKTYPIELKNWTRKDLDKIVPNNPVAISLEAAEIITNSAMTNLAFAKGLSKDMYCVIKDSKGDPTGQFCGKASGFIMTDMRPWPRPDDFEEMTSQLRRFMSDLNKVGVTSLVGHASAIDFIIVNRLFHRNDLPMRFYLSMDLRLNPSIDTWLKRVGNLVDFSLGDQVRIVGGHVGPLDTGPNVPDNILSHVPRIVIPEIPAVAGDTEGTGENQWAATTWTKKHWDDLSLSEKMQTEYGTVIQSRKLGWNLVGMHNMGSKAGEIFMQTFEDGENQKDLLSPRYRPLALDHNVSWHPKSMELAAKHKDDVRFGLQDAMFDQREAKGLRQDIMSAQWGELMNNMQPVKELIDKGIQVHIEGGDPFSRQPLKVIQEYVTRKDTKGRVVGLQQAVDRKTALLMTSRWAAKFIDETDVGSIEPGKLADLVIMDGDYLTVPADSISKIPIVMTLVGGKTVYERQ